MPQSDGMFFSEGMPAIEMPIYKCHKKVWALKIDRIKPRRPDDVQDGALLIHPVGLFAPFWMDGDWCAKHKPEEGGYYVQYEDGYTSYSPAKAFEDGYTKVSQ